MTAKQPPIHPGTTLRDDVLPILGLSVAQAAEQLGVPCDELSHILNGRAAITPEMATRLEAWLGAENGENAESWLALQTAYDLWKVRTSGFPGERPAVLMTGDTERFSEKAAGNSRWSEPSERKQPTPPAPAERNHRARIFWDQISEQFNSAVLEWPGAVRTAADQLTREIQQRGAGNVATSMERRAIDAAEIAKASDGYRASQRAKSPRPKKHATNKTETVAAMTAFRREDRTLKQFMAAAEQGSIEGVTIKPAVTQVARFIVTCDAVASDNAEEDAERKYAMSTLEEWWKEAGKNMG